MEAESTTRAVPRLRRAPWALVPHAVFWALFFATFRRWFLPWHDTPREALTALRLAEGDVLYRDVSYAYGPLAPYVDALALRLFGVSLDVLVVVRLAASLAGLEALRRLVARLVPSGDGDGTGRAPEATAASAAITSLVVAACFFQSFGGTWVFPYSVAALFGTVGTWLALELALSAVTARRALLAALVAGLAASSKLEFVVVALPATLLAIALRRPRRELLAAAALALAPPLAAYAAPFAFLRAEHLAVHGPWIAFPVPPSWARLYEQVFWGGSAREFFGGGFLSVVWPSAFLFGAAWAVDRAAPRAGPRLARALPPVLLVLGAAAAWRTERDAELNVLLSLGALAVACEAVRGLRKGGWTSGAAPLAVGLAMLPALARQPFSFHFGVYAAFAAPLALVGALSFLYRRRLAGSAFTAFLLGVGAAQALSRVGELRAARVEVRFPRGTLVLRDHDARLLVALVQGVERATPAGAYVAGFPEPGLVLFLTGRRSPFVDTQFHPGVQDDRAETAMIAALGEKDVRAAFVVEVPMDVWGVPRFGVGYLGRFRAALESRMHPVARFGPSDPDAPWGPRNASATFYVRRPP